MWIIKIARKLRDRMKLVKGSFKNKKRKAKKDSYLDLPFLLLHFSHSR